MNLESYAVIGAGYGDEGKGLLTDYLSRELGNRNVRPMVARQNGGAQAGHTVVTGKSSENPNGKRHVFRHLGAGTINGSVTYLSSSFLVNPIALRTEIMELKSRGINPHVVCHDGAKVTTVFDMMINQMLEESRGEARHGSCGMGINETIRRCEAGFPLTVKMCRNLRDLQQPLWAIKNIWVPQRLKDLGIHTDDNIAKMQSIDIDLLTSDYYGIINHHLLSHDPRSLPAADVPLVIEGAQGLAIDEFLGVFPHVTPSIVGLPAAIKTAAECGRHSVTPIYVTRFYATRHGAGPLPREGEFDHSLVVDATNVHNEWQGTLRFGVLDVDDLASRIRADLDRAKTFAEWNHITINSPKLLMTCLDQSQGFAERYWEGRINDFPIDEFAESVVDCLQTVIPDMTLFGKSFGDSASDVVKMC